MAETQRSSPALSQAARSPVRRPDRPPLGLFQLDETQDLRPRSPVNPPANPEPAVREQVARPRPSSPPPTQKERAIRGVLLGGLAVTAAILATRGSALHQADVLLGSTVLVAGVALLVVMELSRR